MISAEGVFFVHHFPFVLLSVMEVSSLDFQLSQMNTFLFWFVGVVCLFVLFLFPFKYADTQSSGWFWGVS